MVPAWASMIETETGVAGSKPRWAAASTDSPLPQGSPGILTSSPKRE